MRWSVPFVAAMCSLGLSTSVMAQTGPQLPLVGTPPNPTSTTTFGPTESHWIASGFVGSNMGGGANDASHTYGGEIAYLWRGVVGIEGLVDLAPGFKFNSVLLSSDPHVYSYMGNGIAALPIGEKGQFQPFVSVGLGGIHLMSSVFTVG